MGIRLMRTKFRLLAGFAVFGLVSGPALAAGVGTAQLLAPDKSPGDWLSYGRSYDEQRFSPLTAVNADTAGRLGLAWYADLDTARGQEATPLVVDGILYTTTAWSMVKAFDGKTGKQLWSFDPGVVRSKGVDACCDVANRGVAVYQGRVFVGTLDGRLIALDATTGKTVWSVQTTDPAKHYTITGAPRIVKGRVLIGNGGGEFGVRGFISAYDAKDGALAWRFYTVPGNPKDGPDHAASDPVMAKAAKTWGGEWWRLGGGGTVWDAISYDPKLNLVYFGTGNSSPWNQDSVGGVARDNLFLSSIVAVNADTGAYVWHYQTTPGDAWDFDSDQQLILADIKIAGHVRHVLMQAPKNGIFYVLDRTNGKLISAKNFVPVNWTTGIDMKTGRPVEAPGARYGRTGKPFTSMPGAYGAHNWKPMAFSPKTGLVYIPAQEFPFVYAADTAFKVTPTGYNVALNVSAGSLPQVPAIKDAVRATLKGELIAWDPATEKEAWRVQHAGPWNGGVLATAGNIVVQGTAAGTVEAYRADTGVKLWAAPAQTGIIAAPMTYAVDGEQYVAVMAGWGGALALAAGELAFKSGRISNVSRLLVFKLDGKVVLPPRPPEVEGALSPPALTGAGPAVIAAGFATYGHYCTVCHGDAAVSGGPVPDLRHSAALADSGLFHNIVLGGLYKDNGMASFRGTLDEAQIDSVRAYLISRANQDKAVMAGGKK